MSKIFIKVVRNFNQNWPKLSGLSPKSHIASYAPDSVPTVKQLKPDLNGAKLSSQIDLKRCLLSAASRWRRANVWPRFPPHGDSNAPKGVTPSSAKRFFPSGSSGYSRGFNSSRHHGVGAAKTQDEEIQQDHDCTLLEVLQMFRRTDLILNKKKCNVNATTTKNFG